MNSFIHETSDNPQRSEEAAVSLDRMISNPFADPDGTVVPPPPLAVPTKTMRDYAEEDQPREKALRHGIGILSVPELLAIILRTGVTGHPVIELCRDILKDAGNSLHNLQRKTRQQLMQTKGIGPTKAIQIEAIMELTKRFVEEGCGERPVIRQSKDIYSLMRHEIGNLDHEEIWILLLNRRNQVIGRQRMTSGTANASLFDPKPILKYALLNNADGIIMVHNHPSGNNNPSPQDDTITRSLRDAAKAVELRMLDHVIVNAHSFYSYADNGRFLP
ncbi:MAG: DNA repair protein RadC [Muribaculaceae bacterium]|nr:DNA repair protein RadC [Muribaculaceae bacterium]